MNCSVPSYLDVVVPLRSHLMHPAWSDPTGVHVATTPVIFTMPVDWGTHLIPSVPFSLHGCSKKNVMCNHSHWKLLGWQRALDRHLEWPNSALDLYVGSEQNCHLYSMLMLAGIWQVSLIDLYHYTGNDQISTNWQTCISSTECPVNKIFQVHMIHHALLAHSNSLVLLSKLSCSA